MNTNLRRPKVEPLPLSISVPLPSIIEPHWASQVGAQIFTRHVEVCHPRWVRNLAVIISSHLDKDQEEKLLDVLGEHKKTIGWTIANIKEISPSVVMHQIHLEENAKTSRELQRHLNPILKEVVRAEVMKLLDAGIIYPISDSQWISPV